MSRIIPDIIGVRIRTKDGELLTVQSIENNKLRMQLYDTQFSIVGETSRFQEWLELTGAEIIDEDRFQNELENAKKTNYKLK